MGTTIKMPQAIESERELLSCILIGGKETIKQIDHIVTKDDFYDKNNAIIYRAMRGVWQSKGDIDFILLTDFLIRKDYYDTVGGSDYILKLMNISPTSMNAVIFAKLVADRAVARRIIIASTKIMTAAAEADDMNEFVIEAETLLKGVTRTSARKQSKLAIVDLEEWREAARLQEPGNGQIRGLSLGYSNFDSMTEGFEPGEVMILTGYTKHGKSKLAANLAWNVAQAGGDVMFINTEMTKMQIARRINAMTVDSSPTKGRIYVNDRSDLEYKDAISIMEHAKELGCAMVIVDHLHFFSRSVENQTNELSKITKEFKEAAVQLELPLILLCHIKQGDTTKKPQLRDLKGSSSIAQDADIVIAVWRDDRPNAADPFTTEVMRLAHRSAERAITRITLYADGIRLVEDKPLTTEQQRTFADDVSRIVGEGNEKDDEKDLESGWDKISRH